ncbi:MAG: Flp family type IVb pilin [Thermoleophilia bacterium]
MLKLYTWVVSHLKSEEGAAMVEYGLLVAGIAVLVMVTVFLLGGQINTLFQSVLTKLGGAV